MNGIVHVPIIIRSHDALTKSALYVNCFNRLAETVQQLEAAVKERQQISSIREDDSKDREKGASNRMRALVTRRQLIDLAKLQGEQIKFLKNQVETLRRRTFASFSIPQVTHNPGMYCLGYSMPLPLILVPHLHLHLHCMIIK
jgi:hypothetical protein